MVRFSCSYELRLFVSVFCSLHATFRTVMFQAKLSTALLSLLPFSPSFSPSRDRSSWKSIPGRGRQRSASLQTGLNHGQASRESCDQVRGSVCHLPRCSFTKRTVSTVSTQGAKRVPEHKTDLLFAPERSSPGQRLHSRSAVSGWWSSAEQGRGGVFFRAEVWTQAGCMLGTFSLEI